MKQVETLRITITKERAKPVAIDLQLTGDGFDDIYSLEEIKGDDEKMTRIMDALRPILGNEPMTP